MVPSERDEKLPSSSLSAKPMTANTLGGLLVEMLKDTDQNAPLGNSTLALEVLELAKWPNGPLCPACNSGQYYRVKDQPGRIQCTACKKGYSIRGDTPLEGSIVALDIWVWSLRKWSQGKSLTDIESELAADRMTSDLARRFVKVLRSRIEVAPQSLREFASNKSSLTARFVQVGVAPQAKPEHGRRWMIDLGLVAGWLLVAMLSLSGSVAHNQDDSRLRLTHLGTVKYRGERQYLTMIGDTHRFYTPIDPVDEDPEVTKVKHIQAASTMRLVMIREDSSE
jgi:hypothetical protein